MLFRSHRRNWRERKLVHSEIPELSIEDSPSSSSQEAQVPDPDSTVGYTDYYYSDHSPQGGVQFKNSFHPTPEVEEVKEVTKVYVVNRPLFPSTPQPVVHYIPIIIHTPLLPPPFTHQAIALPPPPPMAHVPGFLLNKHAPLALPQVLNDMPQDYVKILP